MDKGGAKFFLATHVDDGPCTGNEAGFKLAIECLKSVFEITITKEPKMILGVQFDRDWGAKSIKLHQTTYIKSILRAFGLQNTRGRSTPMEKNTSSLIHKKLREIKERGEQGRETDLKQRIGKLIYLKTRPDIAFASGFISRFGKSAGNEEVKMANDIIRYLGSYPGKGITFKAGDWAEMHWYSDSDLGGDPISSKSTSGIVCKDGAGNTLFFRSWLQRKVADSTGMAETYAAHDACKLIKLYVGMWQEAGMKVKLPVKLYVDSDNVCQLNKGVSSHHASRHYRLAQAFICEKVQEGLVELVYVPTDRNPADLLTKPLAFDAHHRHSKMLMGA